MKKAQNQRVSRLRIYGRVIPRNCGLHFRRAARRTLRSIVMTRSLLPERFCFPLRRRFYGLSRANHPMYSIKIAQLHTLEGYHIFHFPSSFFCTLPIVFLLGEAIFVHHTSKVTLNAVDDSVQHIFCLLRKLIE